jgi:hypothetical protein
MTGLSEKVENEKKGRKAGREKETEKTKATSLLFFSRF